MKAFIQLDKASDLLNTNPISYFYPTMYTCINIVNVSQRGHNFLNFTWSSNKLYPIYHKYSQFFFFITRNI